MCNGHNHWHGCPCAFGGDTGSGCGGRWHAAVATALHRVSAGWAKDIGARATVESYVNPNAHCPECDAPVFFYRSPYNGRVFFDKLGWPWPKHPCTDNGQEPRRTTLAASSSSVAPHPPWRLQGWEPLLSPWFYSSQDHLIVTCRFRGELLELYLPVGEHVDCDGPIFARETECGGDIFEIFFLQSDHLGTCERKSVAFRERIKWLGDATILGAASNDPAASNAVGQFILWELDDPTTARSYLERAVAAGMLDGIFDLAIAKMMSTPE